MSSFYKNTTAGVCKKERWNRTQIAGSKRHDGQNTDVSICVCVSVCDQRKGENTQSRRDEDKDDANNQLSTKNTAEAKSD